MGYDIGPRIGIKGEKEFNNQIEGINQNLKLLGSEMKAVTTSFDENADSQEALIAKNKVLVQQLETQKQKLSLIQGQIDKETDKLNELKIALESTTKEFGENSVEVQRAQTEYKKQSDSVNKLKVGANETKSYINKLSKEIGHNDTALQEMTAGTRDATTGLKKVGDEAQDTAGDLKDVEKSAEGMGDAFAGAFAGGAIADQIGNIGSALKDVAEESKEHLKIMGALKISSDLANYSASETADTYMQLYGILGDDQTAATATANLQALGLSQDQLKLLTEGAIGAWAKYGDSIPIDGLSEAINETVQVGKVTGTFADVLNWAGTSEDDFNAKLEKCASKSERANMVLDELSKQGLTNSAEKYRENNKALVENNEAQGEWQDTLSGLGEKILPVMTTITEALNGLLEGFLSLPEPIQIMIGVALALAAAFTVLSPAIIAITMAVSSLEISLLPIIAVIAGIVAAITAAILIFQNWGAITDWFSEKWNEFSIWFEELVDGIVNWFKEKWQALSDWWSTLCDSISSWFHEKWNALCEWFENIMDGIAAFFTDAWEKMTKKAKEDFQSFYNYIKPIIDDIKKIFGGIIDFITGVFTGDWGKAWDGIVSIFDGIVSGIVDIFRKPLNWIIDGINDFISGINDIKIPDWVPGVGGKSMNIPKIPRLKVGMDFVPSDYFPAFLDYGEAVLTKDQNRKFRAMGGVEGMNKLYEENSEIRKSACYSNPEIKIVIENPVYLNDRVLSNATNVINTRDYNSRLRMKGIR